MSTRNDRPSGWFKMSSAFYMDSKILKVSANAELLFLRMLALCSATNSGGVVTGEQVTFLNRGLRSLRAACLELCDAELIRVRPAGGSSAGVVQEQRRSSAGDVQEMCRSSAGVTQELRRSGVGVTQELRSTSAGVATDFVIISYNRWNSFDMITGDETAGQRHEGRTAASKPADRPHAGSPARGPAREKTDRKTDRTESSPASPDGLDSVARAAPRLGGAESRPAPETKDQMPDQRQKPGPGVFLGDVADRQGDGDSLDGLEHLTGPALAKAALSKAIANGSRPIRLPVRMSKYPRELYPTLETEKAGDDE